MLSSITLACVALLSPARGGLMISGSVLPTQGTTGIMPRRAALFGSAFCALTAATSPAHADESCMSTCLRECKALVPGNDGYCEDNCKVACATIAAKEASASSDVAVALADGSGASKDDDTVEMRGSDSVGVFGRASDSGLERFAASIFGATKQASDPRVADRDAFVNDIVSSFKSLLP
jgi:hypothetical protein